MVYGFNNYYVTYLSLKNLRKEKEVNALFLREFWKKTHEDSLPKVTTQLPIYNEKYVAKRLLEAVVGLDYPRGLHEIQVLDDSTDETRDILARLVEKYRGADYNIKHITRQNRRGFKAGALDEGLRQAEGECVAIFDADFLPERDFLKKTVPFFYRDKRTAFVQTRWGHINRNYSLLTRVQGIALDGHFVIEQGARGWNGLYMNFNGTAGIWRKEAIIDAGGWHSDTLTEDLDLSYRAQLRGWGAKFLYEVITPSELPIDVDSFKNQQYRWAKGTIQTARKLLPDILKTESSQIKKLEALFHLTNFGVYPFLLITALLALPLLPKVHFSIPQTALMIPIVAGILSGALGPSILHLMSQKVAYKDWRWRCLYIPVMLAIYSGISLNNTRAVIEGLFTKGGEFGRTPKYGINDHGKVLRKREPVVMPATLAILEVFLGLYSLLSFLEYIQTNPKFPFGPFLLLYSLGFLYVGGMSLVNRWREDIRG
jgi:cellulose synthase/poly-beta-1,6-N-acetylglucosamine synthase-like glycosyltransferase